MKSINVVSIALCLSACASMPEYRADWTLVGINDGAEKILADNLTRYECRKLGRKHIKRARFSGWPRYEHVVCR